MEKTLSKKELTERLGELIVGPHSSHFSSIGCDVETPSRRLLFKMAFDEGWKYAEEHDKDLGMDFRYSENVCNFAHAFCNPHYDKEHPNVFFHMIYSYMCGVTAYIMQEKVYGGVKEEVVAQNMD